MYGRHREAQNQTTASTSSVLARGTGSDPGKGNRRLRQFLQHGTMAFTTLINPGSSTTSVGPTLPIVRPGLQKCGRTREQRDPHREPCATPLLQEVNRVQEVRQTTNAGRITRSQGRASRPHTAGSPSGAELVGKHGRACPTLENGPPETSGATPRTTRHKPDTTIEPHQ